MSRSSSIASSNAERSDAPKEKPHFSISQQSSGIDNNICNSGAIDAQLLEKLKTRRIVVDEEGESWHSGDRKDNKVPVLSTSAAGVERKLSHTHSEACSHSSSIASSVAEHLDGAAQGVRARRTPLQLGDWELMQKLHSRRRIVDMEGTSWVLESDGIPTKANLSLSGENQFGIPTTTVAAKEGDPLLLDSAAPNPPDLAGYFARMQYTDGSDLYDVEAADELVKLLPGDMRLDPRYAGLTVLHASSYLGNCRVSRLLLACKAQVNAPTADRSTPLHVASCAGHADMVKLLLDDSAEVNACKSSGETPLHLVISECGHHSIVKLLLDRGAKVEAPAHHGGLANTTPLHIAAYHGHSEIIVLLLQRKAPVHATNECGDTPLISAASTGNSRGAWFLVKHHAAVDHVTGDGSTAVMRASYGNSPDSVALIAEAWSCSHFTNFW